MRRVIEWMRAHVLVSVLLAFIAGGIGGQESSRNADSQRIPAADSSATESAATAALADAEDEIAGLEAERDDLQQQILAMAAEAPLPDYTGEEFTTVTDLLTDAGWVEGKTTFKETDSEVAGVILSQSPRPGTKMHFGDAVDFVLAKEPPPGWKDLKVWTGSGSFNTPEVNIPDGKVRLSYTFTGNTYTGITMYRRPNHYVNLFLNEVGDRSANTRVYYSGRYYFEIEGGSWTVKLQVFE